MARLPVVASLLISVVVVALFAVLHMAAGKDLFAPIVAVYGLWVAAVMYSMLRFQALSAMERCTIHGVIGSMMVITAFHFGGSFGLQEIRGWLVGVVLAGGGILVILVPYLFKERLERRQEQWDQAARYWKQRRLERRKLTS